LIRETVQTITGLDGRKMSKTYGNEIPVLADSDTLKRLVLRIVTDSRRPEDPKDPEQCNVFALYRHFADAGDIIRLRERYLAGGVAYQTVKKVLVDLLVDRFAVARRRYKELIADRTQLRQILDEGASTARDTSQKTLTRVRQAVGIDLMFDQ
jgi:tryptophanyl-tRNA synthetase